ncbi:hypothetical protein [Prevotella sp.]|uniref:hypothetical protein n=1 Tax=Prevotella sp. TaxID=59823 RepID=UPI002F93B3C6
MIDNFESKLRTALVKRTSQENAEFILSQIKSDERDENLKIMDNGVYDLLKERGLSDVFKEAYTELGIKWNHDNEPPY